MEDGGDDCEEDVELDVFVAVVWARRAVKRLARKGRLVGMVRVLFGGGGVKQGAVGVVVAGEEWKALRSEG